MSKISTIWGYRPKFRHWLAAGLLLAALPVAQDPIQEIIGREPANYVPNDDVIVVPVDAEMSFYEKHFLNDKVFSARSLVQQQIKIWQENELMAQQYGLDTQSVGSLYYVPTNDEKFQVVQRSYFRYLQKKGEDPFKQGGQSIVRDWTANDEVNSIDEMESAFRATVRRDGIGRPLPKAFQQRQVAKTKKFRFNFQPRIEQGLIILRMEGPIVDVRAWVAANGETELNAERRFEATGTRFFVNYFAHEGRYLSVMDQDLLYPGLRARFTSTWDPDELAPERANERRYQLQYSTAF
jgi:hypothetical protein